MKDETLLPEKMTADYAWGNLGVPAEDCSAWANGWNARAALQSGNSAQPVTVPAGYVLVPVDLLSDLRDFAHPEIEKYCEMWEGRRDAELPAMRKIISDADALLSAGWIPVSERMPDKVGLYLCWGTYFDGAEPDYIPASFFIHPTNGWSKWEPVEDDCDPNCVTITHWQPLPDAPKVPGSQLTPKPEDRLQKAIIDACIVFLHGCDSLSKNYECDFYDSETDLSFCIANVAKKIGVVEETGNRRWSISQQMRDEINGVYRKYAMRIMEAATKVTP